MSYSVFVVLKQIINSFCMYIWAIDFDFIKSSVGSHQNPKKKSKKFLEKSFNKRDYNLLKLFAKNFFLDFLYFDVSLEMT